jgi:hypothetical protein
MSIHILEKDPTRQKISRFAIIKKRLPKVDDVLKLKFATSD